MFWGLVLEPGKRYSTTVEKSFHVSKAVLDCSSVRNDNEILSVMLETEGSESLLCNLCKHKGIMQESLDLNFMTGDRLTFECRGHGRIHLSGYLLPDDDDDMSGVLGDEESEEEEPDWSSQSTNPGKEEKKKRKLEVPPDVPPKKIKGLANEEVEEEEEEDDSDDEDDDESDLSGLDDEDLEDDVEASDKDEDDDSEDEEEENFETSKEKKKNKNKTPNKQNQPQNQATPKKTPVTNGLTPKEQKSNKKSPGGEKTPNSQTPKQKQVLEQGVVIKDVKIGNGPLAKLGKNVSVYYVGKLKDSGKAFDKQVKGEGFKFKLGRGEVIKGWDLGVQGMKVGGKRVIHCPPEAAYGAKGVPPKIPPNSTLIFDIELKNVL